MKEHICTYSWSGKMPCTGMYRCVHCGKPEDPTTFNGKANPKPYLVKGVKVEIMKTYTVTWEIQVDAGSKVEAAKNALDYMQKIDSTANVFEVKEYDNDKDEFELIDLQEIFEGKGN